MPRTVCLTFFLALVFSFIANFAEGAPPPSTVSISDEVKVALSTPLSYGYGENLIGIKYLSHGASGSEYTSQAKPSDGALVTLAKDTNLAGAWDTYSYYGGVVQVFGAQGSSKVKLKFETNDKSNSWPISGFKVTEVDRSQFGENTKVTICRRDAEKKADGYFPGLPGVLIAYNCSVSSKTVSNGSESYSDMKVVMYFADYLKTIVNMDVAGFDKGSSRQDILLEYKDKGGKSATSSYIDSGAKWF